MQLRKVLVVYPTMIPSVLLCGLYQLIWLQERDLIEYRVRNAIEVSQEDIEWSDTVFFVRSDSSWCYELVKFCISIKKNTVYILDDDLLAVPANFTSGSHYDLKTVKQNVLKMLKATECLASPSFRLLEKYKQPGQRTFTIIEPSVFRFDEKPKHEDGSVRIGFAGSTDRGGDVDLLLSDALETIAAKYGDRVKFEFFGSPTDISKKLGADTIPYLDDYGEYQKKMAELNWDIGLAPMPESEFHACKHYNKLVEYAGFGIAGIYSKVPPYTDGVEDGVTGLLCENTSEAWVDAISRLIEDTELRKRISDNCLSRAKSEFSVEIAAKKLYEDLMALPIRESVPIPFGRWGCIKFKSRINELWGKVRLHGWQTPIVAVKKIVKKIKR